MTELTSKNQLDEVEIDLKQVLNLIKHSYKLIAIITVIFLTMGIYYAQTRPPAYRSTAMIEVENNSISSSLGSSGSGQLLGLTSQRSSTTDIETVLLKTPYVLGHVVKKLGLDISVSPHYSGFFARKLARFKPINGSVTVSFLTVPNDLLAKPLTLVVRNNNQYLLFVKGKKILDGAVGQLESAKYFSEPLQIQVTALNAKPSTKFDVFKTPIPDAVDGIAGGLDIREEKSGTGILSLSYISGSPNQSQTLLNAILSAAVEKNMKTKSQEAAKTLQFISDQLPVSTNHLQKSEIKLARYDVKSGIFNAKSEGQTLLDRISALKNTLRRLKFKKMVLLQKFTRLHPLVIAVTQKEQEVQTQINAVKTKLQKLPVAGEKETNLQRDARVQAGIYTALEESAQKMEMMKASTVSDVQILSSASYPTSPIPVKKKIIILGSFILGLVVSLVIIFLRHMLSPAIEDPDVVERILGVAVAAIIPYSEKQVSYNKKIKRNKLYANTNPFLLSNEDPNDMSIEGIRSLRTAIQMSLIEAKNNVIAITGCSPAVGKSFISSNLAALFSDTGKRVLLIDSDMRLGKLNQCFGKLKAPGLATYLQNEIDFEKIIQNIIPEKLDFIATGLYPKNPSELVSKKIFGELIHAVASQYDVVVIDTPPILAVTDPALILCYAATNLMVLGVGKDQMKEALHAKAMLEKSGIILMGVVFNTLKQQKSGFGYNYGYSNYHYAYGK